MFHFQVKIAARELEKVIAGLTMRVANHPDEVDFDFFSFLLSWIYVYIILFLPRSPWHLGTCCMLQSVNFRLRS